VYSLTIDQYENIYAGTLQNGVYRSTDNGNIWEEINNGLHNKNIFRVQFIPFNLVFACSETDGGIYRSTDFGENWDITGVTAGTINRAFISELGDIYTATFNGVQKYNAETNKWSVLGLTSVSPVLGLDWLSDIIMDNDDVLFASSWAGDVYKSSDNGTTWDTTASVDTAQTHILDMVLYPDNSILLGIFGYIKRSTDKGASWIKIINGLPNSITNNIAVTSEGIVYAVSQDKLCRANHIDSLFIVIKDSIYSSSPPIYNRLSVGNDGLIFLASQNTDSGIYRSTNYGDSWVRVSDHESVASISISEDKYVVAGLGAGQGVLLSSDLGDTWFQINGGLPTDSYITWNQIDTDGYLYAAVAGRGLYKTNAIVTSIDENYQLDNYKYLLEQNYPNPFNPKTKIQYTVGKKQFVSLIVFDLLGRKVLTLVNEEKPIGNYEVEFDGTYLSSGIYFYQLRAGGFIQTKKMILLK
jgi:photosystem II stability/assembly factor-like uncharacterized protein